MSQLFSRGLLTTTLSIDADLNFVLSPAFIWKVALIVGISAAPLWIIKWLKGKFAPTQYAKLRDF